MYAQTAKTAGERLLLFKRFFFSPSIAVLWFRGFVLRARDFRKVLNERNNKRILLGITLRFTVAYDPEHRYGTYKTVTENVTQ